MFMLIQFYVLIWFMPLRNCIYIHIQHMIYASEKLYLYTYSAHILYIHTTSLSLYICVCVCVHTCRNVLYSWTDKFKRRRSSWLQTRFNYFINNNVHGIVFISLFLASLSPCFHFELSDCISCSLPCSDHRYWVVFDGTSVIVPCKLISQVQEMCPTPAFFVGLFLSSFGALLLWI